MTTYALSKHIIQDGDARRESYNIEYDENGARKCIRDVTTDFEAVSAFVDKLNREEADCVHIYELIEDFLLSL